MSLLNDALRAAEERQTRPQVAGSYTGQPVAQSSDSAKTVVVIVLITVLALFGGAGAWWLLSGSDESDVQVENVSTAAVPEPAAPAVTPELRPVEPAAEESIARIDAPEPDPVIAQRPAEEPAPQIAPEPSVSAAAVTSSTANEPAVPQRPAVAEQPPTVAQPQTTTVSQTSAEPVKQQRETPGAIDLRTSRDLSRLLATGQAGQAEQTLAELTSRQSAPRSRAVFAREMLVQGMANRALDWLPDSLTNEHANLRLLKARALLSQGELDGAVAMLAARVPPVAEQVEYRITLATLLQQAGEADEAAGHWSELIAYDDSQAAWWLGLAIALETGGRNRSAVQAYAQATAMPGLSASLADYARERLLALQAGS
ncbi:MSHA biogenesis protein MshN [Marinobacter halophilus]|uniref:MSHA biogenesis protein MshN n=1 Tax=Marinobacter halophilus TaxID=1323740 RepID=A0A2T1KG26_9GAMM|nr:MSHA biogenesis protein MshN [Marinobacter halophilus]PSF09076.1 MSHA biogenesis protein MshN [Marinobacter halophilus]GGC83634.1 hypothetical protein GCM10011362_35030 [Marinobacter halophilus]